MERRKFPSLRPVCWGPVNREERPVDPSASELEKVLAESVKTAEAEERRRRSAEEARLRADLDFNAALAESVRTAAEEEQRRLEFEEAIRRSLEDEENRRSRSSAGPADDIRPEHVELLQQFRVLLESIQDAQRTLRSDYEERRREDAFLRTQIEDVLSRVHENVRHPGDELERSISREWVALHECLATIREAVAHCVQTPHTMALENAIVRVERRIEKRERM